MQQKGQEEDIDKGDKIDADIEEIKDEKPRSKMQNILDQMSSSNENIISSNDQSRYGSSGGNSLVRKQSIASDQSKRYEKPEIRVNTAAINQAIQQSRAMTPHVVEGDDSPQIDYANLLCQPFVARSSLRNEDMRVLGIERAPHSDDGSDSSMYSEEHSLFAPAQMRPMTRDERIQQVARQLGVDGLIVCDTDNSKEVQLEKVLRKLRGEDEMWHEKLGEHAIQDLFSERLDRMPDSYTFNSFKDLDLRKLFAEDSEDYQVKKKSRRRRKRINSLQQAQQQPQIQRKTSLDINDLSNQDNIDKKLAHTNKIENKKTFKSFLNHPIFQNDNETLKSNIEQKLCKNLLEPNVIGSSIHHDISELQKQLLSAYLYAQNRMQKGNKNLIGTVLNFATDFVVQFLSPEQHDLPSEVTKLLEPQEFETNINLRDVESDFFNENSQIAQQSFQYPNQLVGQKRSYHVKKRAKLSNNDSQNITQAHQFNNQSSMLSQSSFSSSLHNKFQNLGIGAASDCVSNFSDLNSVEQKRDKKTQQPLKSRQLIQCAVSQLPQGVGTKEQILACAYLLVTEQQRNTPSTKKTLEQALSKHLVSLPASVHLNTQALADFVSKKGNRNDEQELTSWIIKYLQTNQNEASIDQIKKVFASEQYPDQSNPLIKDIQKCHKRIHVTLSRHPQLFVKSPKQYRVEGQEQSSLLMNHIS